LDYIHSLFLNSCLIKKIQFKKLIKINTLENPTKENFYMKKENFVNTLNLEKNYLFFLIRILSSVNFYKMVINVSYNYFQLT